MSNEDLFSNNQTNVLGRVSDRLRVLLDLRHRLKNDKENQNIVDLKTRTTQKRVGQLIDKYKRLLRPSMRYFTKYGTELNIHDYQEFDERMKKIAETINTDKAPDEKFPGASGAKPRTNVIEIGSTTRERQPTEGEELPLSTSMDRIQQFLEQCEIDFQDLPVELQLAAIEYLMNQNETEFMTFINFIYHNLSEVRGELQRRRGGDQPTSAEKNRQQMQEQQGMEMGSMEQSSEPEEQAGSREVQERRDQPEAQIEKKMAFSKQLDKVNALMAKIEMAMGMQPKFNPPRPGM